MRPIAVTVLATCVLTLAACTTTPTPISSSAGPTAAPTGASDGSSPATGPSAFPPCDVVAAALSALLDGLDYDADLSASQTADEAYAQRVCVYTTPAGDAQIGVTFAAIPFQQSELEAYRTLPNALADDRLAERGAVLQTFEAGDGDDGHLDSALYLFDEQVSVTIQGYAAGGADTTTTLPGLTLNAAADAAFAARALVD
jgi:hypothetical protein